MPTNQLGIVRARAFRIEPALNYHGIAESLIIVEPVKHPVLNGVGIVGAVNASYCKAGRSRTMPVISFIYHHCSSDGFGR